MKNKKAHARIRALEKQAERLEQLSETYQGGCLCVSYAAVAAMTANGDCLEQNTSAIKSKVDNTYTGNHTYVIYRLANWFIIALSTPRYPAEDVEQMFYFTVAPTLLLATERLHDLTNHVARSYDQEKLYDKIRGLNAR